MKARDFDKIARDLFGAVLRPFGFSCERSKFCVFYREASEGFFHLIVPDLGLRGAWYDVKVTCFSSVFDLHFYENFPDGLGVPTDVHCFLSERGIGPDQTEFNCRSEENLRRRFLSTVGPLLTSVALPYLDRFRSLREFLPEIRDPLYRAIAEHHVNGRDAAEALLTQQKQRLADLDSSDEKVVAMRKLIDDLIGSST